MMRRGKELLLRNDGLVRVDEEQLDLLAWYHLFCIFCTVTHRYVFISTF